MGDRANICVKSKYSEVYLYTHCGGTELPEILKYGLIRGQSRWDDDAYLARILFCEMVRNEMDGTTGYGISSAPGDGEDRILTVDTDAQTVTWPSGATSTFEEFVASEQRWQ